MSSPTPVLTVIIATYNNRSVLERCLQSWEHHAAHQPVELLVVADGCQDDTESLLAEQSQTPWGRQHLRWVTETNVHELRCTNRGLRDAHGQLLMSWHDDMFLRSPALVPELIATFAAYPEIGLVSLSRGLICRPAPRPTRWEDLSDWSRIESTIGRTGWNWFRLTEVDGVMRPWIVRRACIDRVGPLDEAFKLTEWDEVDLCFRIRAAGWKVATHGYERLGYYEHLGSSTLGRTVTDRYKAQALANGQLFFDRWSSLVERDADRPRRTWVRRTGPQKWAWTLQRAFQCSLKAARPRSLKASTAQ
jgi:GT2 family glycosyltransferase